MLFFFLAVFVDFNDFIPLKISVVWFESQSVVSLCNVLRGIFFLYVLCQGISCLICNAHHVLPTVFLQGSQRASSHKVTSVLGHVSLLECLPPLILHLSYTDTQIFSFFATCLPETKETGRIKLRTLIKKNPLSTSLWKPYLVLFNTYY